ncbi:MAG: 1-acyl-sn-glycerol-3-phosphate acyltransferase [Myxococcota bacterium]
MGNASRAAPIFRFNEQRAHLVRQTVSRVCDATTDPLHALNDAAYHETRRLDGADGARDQERLDAWKTLARRLGRMSTRERQAALRELVTEYAEDIAGNFDPRVYSFSTRLVPTLVTGLLNPRRLVRSVSDPASLFSFDLLREKVRVEGDIEKLRRLADIGTLVFTPTHSSNLDSIVFGFALEASGLPPSTYGAGKNLFTNPLLSFFMENLGAYRVDRRLRHHVYKDCLKAYSTVLIENGFHSLFFPGGTRSRSGMVERHLKLGLVGTGIEAYNRTLLAGRERKVFFVPSTINYLITLEAETLIADFLEAEGRARYIIVDDESSRLARVAAFARKLLGLDGSVVIRFGRPLDPFGATVDDAGTSHDRRGRSIDSTSYCRDVHGAFALDEARNGQYTRELGQAIARQYGRETVLMSTHIVAAAAFSLLRQATDTQDLFAMLRVRDEVVDRDSLAREVNRVRDQVIDLEKSGEARLHHGLHDISGGDMVAQAMRAFSGYHTTSVMQPRADGVALHDPKLLLYYQNRLTSLGLGYDPDRAAGRSAS